MNNGKISSLQEWLTNFILQTRKVHRWEHYEHVNRQNVLEHTMETILLTEVVIALEQQYGSTKFNAYLLLASAANHDLGEGLMGDVAFNVKNDPRVKDQLRIIEREKFREMLAIPNLGTACITVAASLEHAFDLQDDQESFEGRLFNAIEKLGYIIFALRELKVGNGHFVEVLERQHGDVARYADEFVSIKMLYEPIKDTIESYLKEPAR